MPARGIATNRASDSVPTFVARLTPSLLYGDGEEVLPAVVVVVVVAAAALVSVVLRALPALSTW